MADEDVLVLEEVTEAGLGAALGEGTAWTGGAGLLALVAEADRETAVPLLQRVCSRLGLPLAGAVFPALVSGGAFLPRGAVLLRLAPGTFTRIYPLDPSEPDRVRRLAPLAADVLARLEDAHDPSLLLVFDGMVPDIASLLDALYLSLADGVRYLGVNAGSETFRPMPCLFDGERQVQGGVLAVLLPSHPGAAVEHGYRAPDRKLSATATEGNRIVTIDWRPAFEVYREAVLEEYGTVVDRESFYRWAVHFPFGIVRADGQIVVRIPVALEADGSLFCVGEVPPDALLTMLRAPEVDSAATVERLALGLERLHGTTAGADLLAFYCAGRRLHLGERAADELSLLERRTLAGRVAGALSLGEVGHAHQWGYPLFHNGAILCCRWGPG